MALNPVETMNVFSESLSDELRKRSLSSNLVRTRTPFLRFTTAAEMSDLSAKLDVGLSDEQKRFARYNGCKFFTLGLHGYDNINYSVNDLYGTQAEQGLVLGTTYKPGQQILVKTYGGQVVGDPAKNYPPPGIINAKVERLRNGNVLRFTVETQCYTQEQLEMLDVMCYVPGMTCVLEWGTQFTTPRGTEPLSRTLDFKNVQQAIGDIQNDGRGPRVDFINKWCAYNNYNYDWAVANIANVKTVVQNNIYKTTITAYGRADNLMYISAYATNNPLKTESDTSTSLSNFFKLNGEFSSLLKEYKRSPELLPDRKYQNQILQFSDGYDRRQAPDAVQASQDTGQANDLGLEDTYFITVPFFIDLIINGPVKKIVETGLTFTINQLIASVDNIQVGYNESLRSTSPEVVIIFNQRARELNAAPAPLKTEFIQNLPNLDNINNGALKGLPNTNRANEAGSEQDNTSVLGVVTTLRDNRFDNNQTNVSGTASLTRGVWLNSKAIQAAFINARTFMEGMEVILRNINAATENYWDLKLFYDDDLQAFRILDDNLRVPEGNSKIYEFNKRLSSTDNDTIGPDVLNIELATDYPRMLFSQLAITGINGGTLNNLASSPDRKDVDFKINTSVRDFLSGTTNIPEAVVGAEVPAGNQSLAFRTFASSLGSGRGGLIESISQVSRESGIQLAQALDVPGGIAAFPNGVPPQVAAIVQSVFNSKVLLNEVQGARIKQSLSQEKLTQDQSTVIARLFAERAKAIIRVSKLQEVQNFERAIQDAFDNKIITDRAGFDISRIKKAVSDKINADRDKLIQEIDNAVSSASFTVQGGRAAAIAASEARIDPVR